jgi:hypothetical protein
MNDTAAPALFDVTYKFDQRCIGCRRSEEEPRIFLFRLKQTEKIKRIKQRDWFILTEVNFTPSITIDALECLIDGTSALLLTSCHFNRFDTVGSLLSTLIYLVSRNICN